MLHHILPRFIPREEIKTYVEPFLGAASVFLALAPASALLADANPHLIACYRAVRNNPRAVGRALATLKQERGKRHYYAVRTAYNNGGTAATQAARFIYLNRTCFNGIFRVNRQGQFNVPQGDKSKPTFPSSKDLIAYSRLLKKAQLRTGSFDVLLRSATKTWFVYLDPPYPPLNGTSFFTHYTKDRFGVADQERLSRTVHRLHARGARFMMTNADTPAIRALYRAFRLSPVNAKRSVSCKNVKTRVRELIITNYSK